MQRVEDFLHDFFQARSEMFRGFGRLCEPVEGRFFTPTYRIWSLKSHAQNSDVEKVLCVSLSDGAAEAITTGEPQVGRYRYRLSSANDSWQIAGVDHECRFCNGSGKLDGAKNDCPRCKGKGWSDSNSRFLSQEANKMAVFLECLQSLPPDEQEGQRMKTEPANSSSEGGALPDLPLTTELLIMPDGKVLAHNLTPAMAAVLSELNPTDEAIKQRIVTHVGPEVKELLPKHWHSPADKTAEQ